MRFRQQPWLMMWAAGGLLLAGLAACGPGPATRVAGDAWDYRLTTADLPAGWTLDGQAALTGAQLTAAEAVTDTAVSLTAAQQVFLQTFTPPADSLYAQLTAQIVLYADPAAATAALMAENPGDDWEPVADAPALGDQSRLWRYQAPEAGLSQNLFRVDARYLNGVASLTLFGAAEAVPDPAELLAYARQVLDRMRAGAEPEALRRLAAAGRPDLRALLLSPEQLVNVDPVQGDQWRVDSRQLGAWVDNQDFSTAEARQVLDRLGRITGYQLYLVKALADDVAAETAGQALFQQVSAYGQAENAASGLRALKGLAGVDELELPPQVGEQARAWTGLFQDQAGAETVAISEISFQQGVFVATVHVQSPTLTAEALGAPELQRAARQRNLDLAQALAEALARNLAAAGQ